MDQETFNKINEQAMKEVIEKFFSNSLPSQKLALQHFLEDFLIKGPMKVIQTFS